LYHVSHHRGIYSNLQHYQNSADLGIQACLRPVTPIAMAQVIAITGASSGFGALAARALADAGHTGYATMKQTIESDVEAVLKYAADNKVDLRALELNVLDEESVAKAISTIMDENGRLDTIVHNAGHMCLGPAEAFTPEEFAFYFDINVLGTQRINRAALPHMRKAGKGFLLWVGSTSTHGGATPFLAPYFAAKAAMDSLAVSYAAELTRWGIETSIVCPGAFTKGTNHFQDAGKPADAHVAQEYIEGVYKGYPEHLDKGVQTLEPPDADPKDVARVIAKIVGMTHGTRPFRTSVDPSKDGSEAVFGTLELCREVRYRRLAIDDLLNTNVIKGS
jgi:NAD(P)-dependent dehydrogenase (short-subunit alcohol dehydrogenase family)